MREPGERGPLHNFEAEQAVLGAILANNAAYTACADFLTPEAFADGFHLELYRAMGRLLERGQPANPITLSGALDFAPVGGPAYLARLVAVGVGTTDAVALGELVHGLHLKRQAVETMRAAIDEAQAPGASIDPAAPISAVADRLAELVSKSATREEAQPFGQVAERVMGTAESIYRRGGGLSGVATGYSGLDATLSGLNGGDLLILAGRPSMGKTALATGLAVNVTTNGLPVGFFSLEMSSEQIGERILAADAGIAGQRTRQGDMTSAEMQRFMNAGTARKALPLYIDDTGALTVAALRARARRMARRHGIGLLIVDYLQLLSGGSDRRDGRTQEVSEITRGLKALAKELDIPVLALSQLSRAVEGRVDKRPMLSDLRESGSIEQDADVVMFVYREEYYLERSDRRGTPAHIDAMGRAEVIIAKQRRGPTATVPLAFDAALTRFRDPVDHGGQRAAA
jgi:replicative DNA helicase